MCTALRMHLCLLYYDQDAAGVNCQWFYGRVVDHALGTPRGRCCMIIRVHGNSSKRSTCYTTPANVGWWMSKASCSISFPRVWLGRLECWPRRCKAFWKNPLKSGSVLSLDDKYEGRCTTVCILVACCCLRFGSLDAVLGDRIAIYFHRSGFPKPITALKNWISNLRTNKQYEILKNLCLWQTLITKREYSYDDDNEDLFALKATRPHVTCVQNRGELRFAMPAVVKANSAPVHCAPGAAERCPNPNTEGSVFCDDQRSRSLG